MKARGRAAAVLFKIPLFRKTFLFSSISRDNGSSVKRSQETRRQPE
jgi:hypothetical protein